MTTQQQRQGQLVRSPIGCKESHRATVRGLGLRKINSVSELQGHAGSARHDQQLPGQVLYLVCKCRAACGAGQLTKEDDGTQWHQAG
jgi:hypothetical protein